MALTFSLERLVHALSNAIMRDQNLVEKAQLSNLLSYFDKDNRPINFDLKLAAMQRAADAGAEDTYRIPLASLVPHGSLILKEAKFALDVEIGSVKQDDSPEGGYPDLQDIAEGTAPIRPKLIIDPEGGGVTKKTNGNYAHITLTLAYAENIKGVARLLNEIIKGQGRMVVAAATDTNDKPVDNASS